VSWEIWRERNSSVFPSTTKSSIPWIITTKIKDEAKHWIIAGAKLLIYLMPGEKLWLGLHG
jgi:hypothetical protein